jgi:ABC-type multidrug transport system ATPase subunit
MANPATQADAPLQRVSLEAVTKRFGRQPALIDADLELTRGRVCVVMGENGAGKSTLLSLLATALSPDRGRIRYETSSGAELRGSDLRRRLGYVSHKPMVYPELSALENVTFFARIGGVADARGAAGAMLERLGLDPGSPKPAAEFSRGMQARLAAARALVTEPELLLLDEAASGLDRQGRRALIELLVGESAERVVVVATHQLDTAASLAEQLVLLHRGRVTREDNVAAMDADARRTHIRDLLDAQ